MSWVDAQNTAVTPAYSGAPINVGAPVFGAPPAAGSSGSSMQTIVILAIVAAVAVFMLTKKR